MRGTWRAPVSLAGEEDDASGLRAAQSREKLSKEVEVREMVNLREVRNL